MTIHEQIMRIFSEQITTQKHCLLSTVRNKLHLREDRELIECAIKMKREHKQLQLLCLVSYVQNKTLHTYYDFARNVQKLLIRQHNGVQLQQLFVEFLCVYVKKDYEPEQIIQIVINSSREVYMKNFENQIERNLTLIPPNAIMANGKMYCEMHPEQFQGLDMSKDLADKIQQAFNEKGLSKTLTTTNQVKTKQSLKTTKSNSNIQPPRIKDSKKHSIQQQQSKQNAPIDRNPQQKEKSKLPKKKLLIQSQSEQYYHPNQAPQLFDLKPKTTSPSTMELENQGNYLENQFKNETHKQQKMEIEHINLSHLNPKQNSPKQTQAHLDENDEDSMDQLMNEMNNTAALTQHQNNKPSLGAKSMPSTKPTKLTEFCSKYQQLAKSQSVKQGNLFEFFGKKKQ